MGVKMKAAVSVTGSKSYSFCSCDSAVVQNTVVRWQLCGWEPWYSLAVLTGSLQDHTLILPFPEASAFLGLGPLPLSLKPGTLYLSYPCAVPSVTA